MRGTAENQIKFISKKLVRSFFIDRKLDYLFLYWLLTFTIWEPAKICRQKEKEGRVFYYQSLWESASLQRDT